MKCRSAEILSIGAELLLGHVDTNAAYLARQLASCGIDLLWVTQVGDHLQRVGEAFDRARGRSDLVIATGGLGPTADDLTREALAASLGETLAVDPGLAEQLRSAALRLGRVPSQRQLRQAMLIPSAVPLPNARGSAPGWWVQAGTAVIICLPGVPLEMTQMWEGEVLPRLRQKGFTASTIYSRTLQTVGLGEPAVEEAITPFLGSPNPTVATYITRGGVEVRITARAGREDEAQGLIAPVEQAIRGRIGHWIYGVDGQSLAAVVGDWLVQRRLTLGTMESCSGGLLASEITDVSGSSRYFQGGLVTYTAAEKIRAGIDPVHIERFGTVSPEVVGEMALAVQRLMGCDCGLAVTGVAGPEALEGKPAGTIYLGLAMPRGVVSEHHQLRPTLRSEIKHRAAVAALALLWRHLREMSDDTAR